MKDIVNAIIEEKKYVADRMQGIDTSLKNRLLQYGYNNLDEYFTDKREYLFNQWKPYVYYIDIDTFAQDVENAIQEEKFGIYIPVADGLYAYHGTDDIDYDLCNTLDVRVVELNYQGGTIIGCGDDLSIEILVPVNLGLTHGYIIDNVKHIIEKHVDGVSISGNDILVDGNKVMGSMTRNIGNTFVWAAQISFGEYYDLIADICNKKSLKNPSRIDPSKLTKDVLEAEVLTWLQKS